MGFGRVEAEEVGDGVVANGRDSVVSTSTKLISAT